MSEAQLFAATPFTETYERVLVGPLFRPFAERLVARLAPQPGDSAIDVACGTGICARIVREQLGAEARIVGVDITPAMLAVARTADPSIDWREGSATAIPVDTERFSMLTCHQGLQFFPDKAGAVREMRRVLAPGGRAGIATWSSLSSNPGVAELNAVAERHIGPVTDTRHGFGEAPALRDLLTDGGFSEVAVETWAHDVRFPDGALFARLNAMALISMSSMGKSLSEAERGDLAGRIAADSRDVVAAAARDGVFVLRLVSVLAFGRSD